MANQPLGGVVSLGEYMEKSDRDSTKLWSAARGVTTITPKLQHKPRILPEDGANEQK